jgi:hypothetical protein
MRFGRALLGANAAGDATGGMIEHLNMEVMRLRIMAPRTCQRTSLEKDRRPYARTISRATFLNIENNTLLHLFTATLPDE